MILYTFFYFITRHLIPFQHIWAGGYVTAFTYPPQLAADLKMFWKFFSCFWTFCSQGPTFIIYTSFWTRVRVFFRNSHYCVFWYELIGDSNVKKYRYMNAFVEVCTWIQMLWTVFNLIAEIIVNCAEFEIKKSWMAKNFQQH